MLGVSFPWEKGERRLKGVAQMLEGTEISESDLFGPRTVTVCPLGLVTSILRACFLVYEMKWFLRSK